jgi:hypothetical protein
MVPTTEGFAEQAPTAHQFHPVLEYWPGGVSPLGSATVETEDQRDWAAESSRTETATHPASVWSRHRATSRFHFMGHRLADFTNPAQVPVLVRNDQRHGSKHDAFWCETLSLTVVASCYDVTPLQDLFLRDVEAAVRVKTGDGKLEHPFHELYDTLEGVRR